MGYITDTLTPEQQKFAKADFNKPCFSVAVAGSGKTTSCIARIEQMLLAGIDSEQILLLSFTKVAARSIINKVRTTIGYEQCKGITGGTFHSVFNRILRKYAKLVGIANDYTLKVDEVLVDAIKLSFDILEFPRGRGCPTATGILKLIHNMKLRDLSIEEAIEIYEPSWKDYVDNITTVIAYYKMYCRQNNILDYDDILLKTYELLTTHPEVRDTIARQYKYIIIDEYQDTNIVQANIIYELLKSSTPPSVTIVGDPNQSIYSFINADINNILSFRDRFPDATEASLTTNFRSNQQILDTCNAIMHTFIAFFITGITRIITFFKNMIIYFKIIFEFYFIIFTFFILTEV